MVLNQGFPGPLSQVWQFARTTHRTQENTLLTFRILKGYNSRTAKWKRCTRQGIGWHESSHALSRHITFPAPQWVRQPGCSLNILFQRYNPISVPSLHLLGGWSWEFLLSMHRFVLSIDQPLIWGCARPPHCYLISINSSVLQRESI